MSRHFFASITRNWISLAGSAVALVSAVLIITLYFVESIGHQGGPYLGILTFLILPAIFAFGLILVPIGIYVERRRLRKHPEYEGRGPFPVIDLNTPKTRGALMVFLGLTVLNIVVLAGATYKGVEVMESVEFCGMACHSVMEPEYTAYQRSPHSRVTCAECHIGPGADWFVKSKLDGAWQMVAVTLDIYPRPIETPLHELRPARDTCEQCHWPTKFVGDKLKIETVYDEDENNTELKNAILLKVGGLEGRASSGIHWHVNPDIEIRYRSDHERMDIYDIEMIAADGTTKTFVVDDAPEDQGEWRTMDCVDCHNRPTHIYRTPGEELDRMLANNKVSTELPYIRREGARIVEEADYESHEAGREGIATSLRAFYRDNYPEVAVEQSAAIETAADALGDIYSWNVFPHMNVRWDTYPDHSGHPPIRSRENAPGCFRCHNRDHKTAEGERISRSCNLCHTVLATREENPEILEQLNP